MPKNKLPKFREEALAVEGRSEHIDRLIQVVSRKSEIALITVYVFLFILLLYGIFGSIPTRVEGRGLLLVENGTVYNAVAPPGGGRVLQILVKVGNPIKKGESIAYLDRPDLKEKIELQKEYVERLKHEQNDLIQISTRELEARHQSIVEQNQILINTVDIEKENLKDIEYLLKFKEENFKKGLVVLQDIETTRRDFYTAKHKTEELQIELEKLKTQEADFKEQWRQRIKDKELMILAEQLKLHDLESELNVSRIVTSPADGLIISLNTSLGKMVASGDSIISIASPGIGLDAMVFMKPHEGQRVAVDMKALVTPTTIEKEEFGSLTGKVLSVTAFPEATEAIIAALHNPELAKQFSESGAPVGIRVRIEKDPKTYSGYKWSSSEGPKVKILPGTMADVRITVREQPPITLIIPALKKLFGVS